MAACLTTHHDRLFSSLCTLLLSLGVQATTEAGVIAESRLGTVSTSNSTGQQLACHGRLIVGEALNME